MSSIQEDRNDFKEITRNFEVTDEGWLVRLRLETFEVLDDLNDITKQSHILPETSLSCIRTILRFPEPDRFTNTAINNENVPVYAMRRSKTAAGYAERKSSRCCSLIGEN